MLLPRPLEGSAPLELLSSRNATAGRAGMLLAISDCASSVLATYQVDLVGGQALNGEHYEEEERRQDCEALCCSPHNAVFPREDGKLVETVDQIPACSGVSSNEDAKREDREGVHLHRGGSRGNPRLRTCGGPTSTDAPWTVMGCRGSDPGGEGVGNCSAHRVVYATKWSPSRPSHVTWSLPWAWTFVYDRRSYSKIDSSAPARLLDGHQTCRRL